jgi:hypothetical protein
MKGQSEILVFVLLFLLSIGLFITAIFWSKGIVQNSVEMASVSSAERNAKDISNSIDNIIKFDGYDELDYSSNGPIVLLNDNTLEIRTTVTTDLALPSSWTTIASDGSTIREMLEGDVLRIQLSYPETDRKIVLFTDGPTLAKPNVIRVEKNATFVENGKQTIKIRITFV